MSSLHIKIIIGLILTAILIGGTVKIMAWREASHKTDELTGIIARGNEANTRSRTIGMDLNHGTNIYESTVEPLSRDIDSTATFDAGSVQRTSARIGAGIAARQRASGVR